MERLLVWIGRLAGGGGALLCAAAAAVRVSGHYWVGSFQAGTLMLAGVAAMIAGCLCLLEVLIGRLAPPR